jgi:hypothetical protein
MAKNKNNKAPQNKQLDAEFSQELVQNNSTNGQTVSQRQNNRNNQNQK